MAAGTGEKQKAKEIDVLAEVKGFTYKPHLCKINKNQV